MREVLRRLIAAFCLYAGIALTLTQGGGYYQVRPVDWTAELDGRVQQSENVIRQMEAYLGSDAVEDVELAPETQGTLEDYIAQETADRLIEVSGPEWEGLWNDVYATVKDRAPTDAWARYRGVEYRADSVYLPVAAAPLSGLESQWPEDFLQTYVRIEPANDSFSARYLDIYQPSPSDLRNGAPTHVAYPFRTFGIIVLLFGLFFYLLLPREPRTGTGMFYQARAAGWLPDLLAAAGSGMFFAVPFLITSDAEGGPLDADWWPLSVLMWGMGSIFATIFVITTWYQTRRLTWDEDRAAVATWGSSEREFRADEIAAVGGFLLQAPRWLRALAWLISVFNWRAASSAILLSRSDAGFSLLLQDGSRYRFTGEGLWGAASFLAWLDRHECEVAPAARALMLTKPDYQAGRAGTVVAVLFAVLTVGGSMVMLVPSAIKARPQPAPVYRSGNFEPLTEPATTAAERSDEADASTPTLPFGMSLDDPQPAADVTPEMLQQEAKILEQIRQVRNELKVLEDQIGTVSNPNAVAIEKVQAAMAKLSELQAKMEAVRSGAESKRRPPDEADEDGPGTESN